MTDFIIKLGQAAAESYLEKTAISNKLITKIITKSSPSNKRIARSVSRITKTLNKSLGKPVTSMRQADATDRRQLTQLFALDKLMGKALKK